MYHNKINTNILFSVIIPSYNSSATIKRAILSSLNQIYKAHEILVYDDASTDDTAIIVHNLSRIYSKIRLVKGKKNYGAGLSRNKLLKIAKGTHFAFLDSDDQWLPNKLLEQYKLIKKFKFDIVGCKIKLFSENKKFSGYRNGIDKLTLNKLLQFGYIGMSGAIVSNNLIDARKMPSLRKRQDYAYFLNLFVKNKNIKIGFSEKILVKHFRSHNSLSSGNLLDKLKYNFIAIKKYGRQNFLFTILYLVCHIINRLRAD